LIANTVVDLYPERVRTEMLWAYDDRIVLFEFNDHPMSTRTDVLNVLIATKQGEAILMPRSFKIT